MTTPAKKPFRKRRLFPRTISDVVRDATKPLMSKQGKLYGALLREFTDLGPRTAISGLGAGLVAVVRDGTRTADGTDLAVYRAKIDPSKATGPFHALAGTSGSAAPMSFTLVVDDKNLLRQVEVDSAGVSTVAFTRWGEPVSIAVPTEDQLLQP